MPKVTLQIMEQPGLVSEPWEATKALSSPNGYELPWESVLGGLSSKSQRPALVYFRTKKQGSGPGYILFQINYFFGFVPARIFKLLYP